MMLKICIGMGLLLATLSGIGQADPIQIGVSLGLTGKYAPLARMQERAYRLWEKVTNDNGGIMGRQVQVVIYDDQSNPVTAKTLYLRMIQEEKSDLLFGPYSSSLTNIVAPIAEQYGYPILAAGASADSIWHKGYNFIFGVYSPASRYTLGFVELALANELTTLAIISVDDPFARSVAEGTDKWALRLGLNVVFRKSFSKRTDQLVPIAREVMNSGAQALIMCGHFDEAIDMRRALHEIQWYPRAYYATVGPVLQGYYEQLRETAEGTFSSTQWMHYDKLPFPGNKDFYDRFVSAYNVEPSYQAAAAYASGVLLKSAIEKAGSLNRKRIRDAIAQMDVMTLLGRYGVDRTGMQIRHFALITQWIEGRKEVVWPVELSTRAPRFF